MGGFGLPFFFIHIHMAIPTTVDTDTELSAVNSILGAIGQSPVTTLNYENPEVGFIYDILTEVNKDVQNEGWIFNTEYNVEKQPEATTKYITIPANVLRYDIHGDHEDRSRNLVRRNGRLYDLVKHTDVFTADISLDITYLWEFEDIPAPFKRYITYRAAGRAATQLVSNPQLVQLLQQQEGQARSVCMEYECNQGDHSFFGWDHHSTYHAYQPYKALQR